MQVTPLRSTQASSH